MVKKPDSVVKATIALLLATALTTTAAAFAGGSGTSSDPYEISTCNHLQNMSSDKDAHYELVSDVDCSDTVNWNNGNGFSTIGGRFEGVLDGKGHVIDELYMKGGGIFSELYKANVKNLGLTNVDINDGGDYGTGAIAEYSGLDGFISNVYVTGSISGNNKVGSILGSYSNAGINRVYSTASVSGSNNVGGLIGENYGNIKNSYFAGSVSGDSNLGGLAGYSDGSPHDSYWDKNTTGLSGGAGTGLRTAKFDDSSELSGLDFSNNWEYVKGRNRGYPVLQVFKMAEKAPQAAIEKEVEFVKGANLKPKKMKFSYPGPSTINSYNWSFSNGYSSSERAFSYNFDSSGSYDVSLNVSNSLGWNETSIAFEIEEYPCTSGTEDTTCIINRTWDIPDGEVLNGTGGVVIGSNATLDSSGSLKLNYSSVEIREGATVSTSGDLDILDAETVYINEKLNSGGNINFSGVKELQAGKNISDAVLSDLEKLVINGSTLEANELSSENVDFKTEPGFNLKVQTGLNLTRFLSDSSISNTEKWMNEGLLKTESFIYSTEQKLKVADGFEFRSSKDSTLNTGDLRVEGVIEVTGKGETLNILADNFSISPTGSIESNVDITATKITVESGGVIDATGRSTGGPGNGQSTLYAGGGGGYGGQGGDGDGNDGGDGGSPYGSIIKPLHSGSNGGNGDASGGDGGGLIILNGTESVTIEGSIKTNGVDGVGDTYETYVAGGGGGGSGGGIFLTAPKITGGGVLKADGGNGGQGYGQTGGGGSGGRIGIETNQYQYTGGMSVNGGGGYQNGEKGTVFRCVDLDSGDCTETDRDTVLDLSSDYNKSTDGAYITRKVNDEWSKGVLNWTDYVGNTASLDSNWDGDIAVEYSVTGVEQNLKFALREDGSKIASQNSGNVTKTVGVINETWSQGFEDGVGDWKGDNYYRKSDRSYEGSYSLGSNGQGTVDAEVTPAGWSGGKKPGNITFYWQETTSQTGFTTDFIDSSGDYVLRVGGNNPQWEIWDGDGSKTPYSSSNNYQDWIMYSMDFNWSSCEYSYHFENLADSIVREGTRSLNSCQNIEKVRLSGDKWGSASSIWFDNFESEHPLNFELKDTVSGPEKVTWNSFSIDDNVASRNGYEISFAENTTGSWNEYGSFSELPESRFVRYNITLDSNPPEDLNVDSLKFDYSYYGELNFSTTLTDEHTFEIVEGVKPESRNQQQNETLVNEDQFVNLSAEIIDEESGLSKAYVETNESGQKSFFSESIINGSTDGTTRDNFYANKFTPQEDLNIKAVYVHSPPPDTTLDWRLRGPSGDILRSGTEQDLTGFRKVEIDSLRTSSGKQYKLEVNHGRDYVRSLYQVSQKTVGSVKWNAGSLGDLINLGLSYSKVGSPPEFGSDYKYQLDFSNPTSWKLADFDWRNESLDGTVREVGWRVWFRDAAGNWDSTSVKSFTVDGKAPATSNLDFDSNVDVDNGETDVFVNVSDSPAGLSDVLISENSSGSFSNTSMNADTGDTFNYTVLRESPSRVDFRIFANDTLDNSKLIEKTVMFQNLTFDVNLSEEKINVGKDLGVEGVVERLPSSQGISDTANLFSGGEKLDSFSSDSGGDFSGNYSVGLEPGSHSLKVNATDPNGVSGLTTKPLDVYNFNLTFEGAKARGAETREFYKDASTDADVSFNDSLETSSLNPSALTGVTLNYEVSSGWNIKAYDSNVGDMNPGDFAENDPSYDIGPDAAYGNFTFNLTAESDEGVTDSDSFKATVYREPKVEHLNPPEQLSRLRDEYVLEFEAFDAANSTPLADYPINVTIDGEFKGQAVTNSSGIANWTWDMTETSVGNVPIVIRPTYQPQRFIDYTGAKVSGTSVDVTGYLREKSRSIGRDTVYRDNESTNSSTSIQLQVKDDAGNNVEDANVTLQVGDKTKETQTDGSGYAYFSYNPKDELEPGKYEVEMTVEKKDFVSLTVNDSIEIRGVLDAQVTDYPGIATNGVSNSLNSTVVDDLGNEIPVNATWYLNGSEIVEGKNTVWKPNTSIGYKELELNATKPFYDTSVDSVNLDVYGLLGFESLFPDKNTYRTGSEVVLSAQLSQYNGENPGSGYDVNFTFEGSSLVNQTGSGAEAVRKVSPEKGTHSYTVKIIEDDSWKYNLSEKTRTTTFTVANKTFVEDFKIDNEIVYNTDSVSPQATDIFVNLTQPSSDGTRVPAADVPANFTVGQHEYSCITGSDGGCTVTYDAQQQGDSAGNKSVNLSVTRSGWQDVDKHDELMVKGVIIDVSIEQPGDNVLRGESEALSASVLGSSGQEVVVPVNWSVNGEHIALSDESVTWDVSPTLTTGVVTLEAATESPIFEDNTGTKDIDVYGEAYVDFVSPDNSSKIGYGESPDLTCSISNDIQSVEDYPVVFEQNGSEIGTAVTNSEGEAVTSWDVPNQVSAFEIGCKISDNQTLRHEAVGTNDSRIFKTKDNVEPEVSNLDLQDSQVAPGSNTTLTFEATDGVEVIDVNVSVKKPNGFVETLENPVVTDSGYEQEVSTDSDLRGTYELTVIAEDSSGNIGQGQINLVADPGGSLNVVPAKKDVDGIKLSEGENFTVNQAFTPDNDSVGVNISASVSESFLSINETGKECGGLNKSDYCNLTVNVEVENGTEPGTAFVNFNSEWKSSSESFNMGNFTTVEVLRNPVLNVQSLRETEEWSTTIFHGNSDSKDFSLNSTGNYLVKDVEFDFQSSDIGTGWVSMTNAQKERLTVGESHTGDLEITVPSGTSPDTYTGELLFTSENAPVKKRDVKIDVTEDRSFYPVNSIVDEKVAAGTNGTLTSIELVNDGNVDLSLGTSFTDLNSKFSVKDTISIPKQQSKEIRVNYSDLDIAGSYSTELEIGGGGSNPLSKVTLFVDAISFSPNIKDSGEVEVVKPGDNTSIDFNVSLGGNKVTENISTDVRIGGIEAENLNVTEESGVFNASFTVPDVQDARTHDLTVEVEDTEDSVSSTDTVLGKYEVPDITPPTVDLIETRNIEPGENITINVSASDNSFEGVKDISLDLILPNGTVHEYNVSEDSGEASKELNLTLGGDYAVEATAVDAAGLNASRTSFFRVSGPVQVSGDFVNAKGTPLDANISFINPNDDSVTSKIDTSSSNGNYSAVLPAGDYDMEVKFSDNTLNLKTVNINDTQDGFLKAEELEPDDAGSPTENDVMGIGVETSAEPDSAEITLDYSDYSIPSGRDAANIKVARCKDYNFSTRVCNGDYTTYEPDSVDKVQDQVTVSVPGFSQYTLFFEKQDTNDTENETQDNQEDEETSTGGGGGGGGLTQDELEDALNDSLSQEDQNESQYAEFGSETISARLRPGESQRVSLSIGNNYNNTQEFAFTVNEVIQKFVSPPSDTSIGPQASEDVIVNISVPASELPSSYTGYLDVDSEKVSNRIPVNLQILPPDKKLLDLSVTPVFDTVEPGGNLKVETTFSNQGYARNVDVTTTIELNDPDTNETLSRVERTFAVGTTLTKVVELNIPDDAERKRYEVRGTARYTNLDVAQTATAVTPVTVATPFWERSIMGLTYANIGIGFFVLIIASLSGYGIYQYRRKKIMEKKRYMEQIDLDTIPSGGRRQGFVGEIAEMGRRTFIDIDDLTTHALIAGATGSGKSVTAQDMVEEALKEGTNVIVLDPTAQWTGFLRECQDSDMKGLYSDFGMSKDDSQGFDGNIRAVEPGQEDIDITPYLNSDEDGEIIVFSMHKMDSANIDEFVNNTIQQVFDENLPERNQLETLIVYDEVHRLLDKFGGSGKGLKQLERGAREFRKWGVGMVLVSQVVSDFSGEIRANIGTTVQMRTQYEADLDRLKNKFGMDTVRSVAKAEVGSGMLQNSDYNHGRPYFVNFRPLLHSPHRLSDEELDKYEDYNRRIDKIERKIDELEDQGEEVYDYRSELKLAKRNLRKGSFNLVDIYVEELEEDLL